MTTIRMVYNHIPRLSREMQRNVGNVVKAATLRVEQESKSLMSGPRHGRIYVRRGIAHQASAPGEPPAVDTGKLKNSITSKMVTPLRGQVIASANYARILEMRRRRRFFKPAVDKIRDWFVQAMDQALGRVR